jgi:hypothetical protein
MKTNQKEEYIPCSLCKKEGREYMKPISAFSYDKKSPASRFHRSYYCKECQSNYNKGYIRPENRDYRKELKQLEMEQDKLKKQLKELKQISEPILSKLFPNAKNVNIKGKEIIGEYQKLNDLQKDIPPFVQKHLQLNVDAKKGRLKVNTEEVILV